MQSYYEILGISAKASDAEIKSAYKKLAKKYHPDVNKEASAKNTFQQVSKAYQILSDPQKRAAYDRMGHDTFEQAQKGGYGKGSQQSYSGFGQGGFSYEDIFGGAQDPFDIFEGIFGSRRYGQERRSDPIGENIEVILNLTFGEAVTGVTKTISYERFLGCKSCGGSGSAKKNEPASTCSTCQGSGQVRSNRSFLGAQFAQVTDCPNCRGTGQIIKNPCLSCSGTGRSKAKETLTVDIPAGVDTGTQIRYSQKGNVGERNTKPGDLFITCKVSLHKNFSRSGNNLVLHIHVTIAQAVLGDTIEIPTIEGKVTVEIPQGTQHEDHITIKNKGVPNLRGGSRGSLIIIVHVQIPKKLSNEQKKVFTDLKAVEKSNSSLIDKLFS